MIIEPIGKVVTQFNNANIKIHLDLKQLTNEVMDSCNLALILHNFTLLHKKRQLVTLGVVAAISLILYYTVSQLTRKAG